MIKKAKNAVPLTYPVENLNGEEIFGIFFWHKIAQNESHRIQNWKSNKEKEVLNYVKQKGYDNSFNNWIDKKEIIM